MTRSRLLLASLALASGTAAQASILLTATLTNASENPPTNPTLVGGAPRPASFGNASTVLARPNA